ncbi:MAG: gamma-glutamylcyclotransferase [Armatimonadetes bacterium]|nr:gamma-glutamylcyclotransferase [Armatimonadota bacterium]
MWVFFYGTFMSARVLREHGVDCESTVPAVLNGHRLTISPRANLVADPGAVAYGGLALLRDEETDSLYKGLEDDYSLVYKPQSVVTKTFEGDDRAALC